MMDVLGELINLLKQSQIWIIWWATVYGIGILFLKKNLIVNLHHYMFLRTTKYMYLIIALFKLTYL